jgi:hypothetical protein
MKKNKQWLCWSPRQNTFHVEGEEDGARRNRRAFNDGRKPDYITIGVFPTSDEACAEARRLTPILREREKERAFPPLGE